MNDHLGVVARVLVQVRRYTKELTKSFDIDWDFPFGYRLDLFGIRACAVLTHDAPKKWYFATRESTLLEVSVQLMLALSYKT